MKWLCFFSVTQKQRLHYTDHIRKLPVSQCANYIFETTKKKRCAQLPSAPFAPSSHPVQPTFVTWWKVECAAGLGKLANVSACICATGMETVYGLCQCMVICTSLWNCMWSHMKEPFKWSFYFCLPLWPWTSLRVCCLAERKKGEKKTSGQTVALSPMNVASHLASAFWHHGGISLSSSSLLFLRLHGFCIAPESLRAPAVVFVGWLRLAPQRLDVP